MDGIASQQKYHLVMNTDFFTSIYLIYKVDHLISAVHLRLSSCMLQNGAGTSVIFDAVEMNKC